LTDPWEDRSRSAVILSQADPRRWLVVSRRPLELPVEERETVDACLRQIDFLDSEVAELERVVALDALTRAEVRRLMSVPV
jgi:transposase